jgi:hypothetical protein
MTHRTLSVILFLLLSCVTAYGQTSYKGLTPGQSTRADVERGLGQPIKDVSKTLVEYKSPGAESKLYVQYRDGSPAAVVERIELICLITPGNAVCEKFRQPVRYVEFDVRVMEPLSKAYAPPSDKDTKATVYFGASRFLRFVEIWKRNGEFEYRVAFFSPELYQATAPKGGCTGSIFGTWETSSSYGSPKYFNLGRVTIERVGDDGIKGIYQKNNGTLTLRRAWENDQNFVMGRANYKGEWKDDTGGGTIEIEVESFNDFRTAEAKLTRTSGTSQAPGTSKNPKAASSSSRSSALEAIIGLGPSWRGNCVP